MVSKKLLSEAAEKSFVALWQQVGVKLHETPDVLYFASKSPFPLFNRAIWRATAPFDATVFESIVHFFQKQNLSYCWLLPETFLTADLKHLLAKNNLAETSTLTTMFLPLTTFYPRDECTKIAIKQVTKPWQLKQMSSILQESFFLPKTELQPFFQRHFRSYLRDPLAIHYYLANLDNEVAGCGSLMIKNGYGEIYNIATKPFARKQGVARAMLSTLLAEAKTSGCTHAILSATPDGQRVYQSLGFEPLIRYISYFSKGE